MGLLIPRNRVALLRREFSPDDLGGLRLWLPADSISGVADGGAVATWPDRSGNAYDASQATAGNRPTLQLGQINGKPAVRFVAASSHYMTLAGAVGVLRAKPGATAFCVYKCNNADTADVTLLAFSTNVNSASRLALTPGITTASVDEMRVRRLDADSAAYLQGGVVVDGGWHLVTAWMDYANDDAKLFHGNGLLNSSTALTAGSGNTSNTDSAAATIGIFTDGSSYPFDGDIAEIIVYDRALADGEMRMVRRYLANKYALALGPLMTSGAASGAVTLGAELLTDGGVETWASATNLTNWTEGISGTSTVNREAVVVAQGSYSARLDIDASGSLVQIYQAVDAPAGTWVKLQLQAYSSELDKTGRLDFSSVAGPTLNPGPNWTEYDMYAISTVAAPNVQFRKNVGVSYSLYSDAYSAKAFTFSTLCTLLGDPAVQIALYRTDGLAVAAGHVAGLLVCATDNDGDASTSAVLVVVDRTLNKIRLFSITAGVVAEAASTNITYADDVDIEIDVSGIATTGNIWATYLAATPVKVGPVTVNVTAFGTKVYRLGTNGLETFIVEVQPA